MQSSAFATVLGSTPVCQEGKPECLNLVIQEMEQRYKPLEAQRDRNGIFALSYLRTTETLQKLLNTVGFDNPTSIVQEDALYADTATTLFETFKNPPSPVSVPEPETAPVLLILGGVFVSITGLKQLRNKKIFLNIATTSAPK